MQTPEQLAATCQDIQDGTIPSLERLRGLAEFAAFAGAYGSWWAEPPIPTKTIVLAWNGKAITPPMSFDEAKEVEFFAKAYQPVFWLRIHEPPGYAETLAKAPKIPNGKAN